MQDLFSFQRYVVLQDGLYEPLSVLAQAIGAIDVFAKAGDDVIVGYGFFDIGCGVFRDEFLVGGATKVALVGGGSAAGCDIGGRGGVYFVFGVGTPEVLITEKRKSRSIGSL